MQLVILLVIKLLIKLQKLEKLRNRIIQKPFQVCMMKKYIKKDIYLLTKDDDMRLI